MGIWADTVSYKSENPTGWLVAGKWARQSCFLPPANEQFTGQSPCYKCKPTSISNCYLTGGYLIFPWNSGGYHQFPVHKLLLIGGDWNILFIFFHISGMSSSQLTHIFQRGRLNHQPEWALPGCPVAQEELQLLPEGVWARGQSVAVTVWGIVTLGQSW